MAIFAGCHLLTKTLGAGDGGKRERKEREERERFCIAPLEASQTDKLTLIVCNRGL